ncbi:hypothetical protein ACLKA6_017540 [Drosophila palustris]
MELDEEDQREQLETSKQSVAGNEHQKSLVPKPPAVCIPFTTNPVHRRTQQLHDQPRPSPYTTASRPTPSIAVHNSFTINLVHRRAQQLHDQPRPSPYTTASRSTSSITIHNGFTIVLV